MLVVRLHDIPNRVREVALHGVHHGVALVTEYPEGYERLVEDFFDAANSVALTSQDDDIVNKVFSDL